MIDLNIFVDFDESFALGSFEFDLLWFSFEIFFDLLLLSLDSFGTLQSVGILIY